MIDTLTILIVNIEGMQDKYASLVVESFPELYKSGKIKIIKHQFEHEITEDVTDVDIIGSEFPLANTVPKIKNLKWQMTFTSGYDVHIKAGVLPREIPLINAKGCQNKPIADYIIALMLSEVRQIPRILEQKKQAKFERFLATELGGKTLGIIGLGGIGQETAKRAKAFDMRVIGTKRTITDLPNVDQVFSADQYEEVLEQSDFVVLSCPENEQTIELIGERQLRMMKPTSYLINVARATIINKEALYRALKEKWIKGAAQDVWWIRQPLPSYLPAEDELWQLDNLFISPHNAGITDYFLPRACAIFTENIRRYLDGQALINVVSR